MIHSVSLLSPFCDSPYTCNVLLSVFSLLEYIFFFQFLCTEQLILDFPQLKWKVHGDHFRRSSSRRYRTYIQKDAFLYFLCSSNLNLSFTLNDITNPLPRSAVAPLMAVTNPDAA